MAVPSLVPSACTAGGPATTSVASVSACQDSLEPCATKVPATTGRGQGREQRGRKKAGQGFSSSAVGIREKKKITVLLKGQAQRSRILSVVSQLASAEMNSDSNILLKRKMGKWIQLW